MNAISSHDRTKVSQRNVERAEVCRVDGVRNVRLECRAADRLVCVAAVLFCF